MSTSHANSGQIRVQCPYCQHAFLAPQAQQGKTVSCLRCQLLFTITPSTIVGQTTAPAATPPPSTAAPTAARPLETPVPPLITPQAATPPPPPPSAPTRPIPAATPVPTPPLPVVTVVPAAPAAAAVVPVIASYHATQYGLFVSLADPVWKRLSPEKEAKAGMAFAFHHATCGTLWISVFQDQTSLETALSNTAASWATDIQEFRSLRQGLHPLGTRPAFFLEGEGVDPNFPGERMHYLLVGVMVGGTRVQILAIGNVTQAGPRGRVVLGVAESLSLESAQASEQAAARWWQAEAQRLDRECLEQLKQLPRAEMYFKGGITIWAMLTVLMVLLGMVRATFGLTAMLVALAGTFAIYLGGILVFSTQTRQWLTAGQTDGIGSRILGALDAVCQRAGLGQPRTALDPEEPEINVFTYGFTQRSARVVVTRTFMDHIQPTTEELQSVLAHEMGHVYHRDCAISTLLQFPLWLMQKIRLLLYWIRQVGLTFGVVFIRGVLAGMTRSGIGGLFIGLMLICMFIMAMVYLSMLLLVVGAVCVVCFLLLASFHREREYLADQYSARLLGDCRPLQSCLAKLELAGERVRAEVEERVRRAGPNQRVSTRVEPPDQPFNPTAYLQNALNQVPGFWHSISGGELFNDHPLTAKRIHYLIHPERRGHPLSRLLGWAGRSADAWLGPVVVADAALARVALALGVGLGLVAAWAPLIQGKTGDWLFLVAFLMGGAGLGIWAKRNRWSGETFWQGSVLAAFICATTLLVVGTASLSPLALVFPVVFGIGLLNLAGYGLLGAALTPPPGSATLELTNAMAAEQVGSRPAGLAAASLLPVVLAVGTTLFLAVEVYRGQTDLLRTQVAQITTGPTQNMAASTGRPGSTDRPGASLTGTGLNHTTASAPLPATAWSGTWLVNNTQRIMLKQEGNVVTGQIDDLRATINGKIEGYSFQGSWKTAQASGSLSLQLAPDLRTFRGTMTPQNTIRSYEWRGTRLADSSAPTTTGTRPRRSRGLGIPPPN